MPEIGNNTAATVATQLLNDFRSIRFGLLIGIGGGIPSEDEHDIRLGDVVVSNPTSTFGGVVQFDRGKIHPNGKFERTGSLKKPPAVLMANVHKLEAEHKIMGNNITKYLADMFDRYQAMEDEYSSPGPSNDQFFKADYTHSGGKTCRQCDQTKLVERDPRRNTAPRIHYGTIGSANQVIKDAETRDKLKEDLGVLCVEMEAAGLMDEFSCLVIRGICDYADSHKNKRWQPYAAATAAAYAKELLSIIPAQEIVRTARAADAFAQFREQDRLLRELPHDDRAAFNSYDKQHDPLCLPETRVDVLKQITEWADDESDGQYIFWLKGMAGTGKSTIARTFAYKYHTMNRLGASFFFSKGGGDASHARMFFTSIAVQLARRSIALRRGICDAISQRGDVASQSLRDQWNQLILKPLSKLEAGSSPSPLIFVIDALDECADESDIQVIIRLLYEAQKLEAIRLRVFMTSRPETSIRNVFNQIPDTGYRDLVLHNIPSSTINQDISLFFNHGLGIIRQERALPTGWPGDETISHLVQSASGLFVWAATACRFIKDGKRFPEKRLGHILKGDPKKGPEGKLNEIYIAILTNSVSDEYDEDEKEELYEMLKVALGAITILFSSLPISALARLLHLQKDEICRTLDDLHSLLEVPEDETHPVRLHHPSFRDFILDKQRCDEKFWVDEKKAHENLVKSCLQLMSEHLKRDICNLGSEGALASDLKYCDVQEHLPADLQYACLYWVRHLRRSDAHVVGECRLYDFLQHHFLHWLEALSLMGKISEGCHTITELSKYLSSNQPSTSSDLQAIIHDAHRFMLKNRPIIEVAPLQVYSSSLVFSPTKSVIKSLFLNQAPRWIKSMPAAEDSWGALLYTMEDHSRPVYSVAFSPDGQFIASTSSDNTIKLWDSRTGALYSTLEGHSDVVRTVAFSKGGRLASGSCDKTIRLWDPKTGTSTSLEGHSDWVRAVTFSPDGELLASASTDKTVKLWDLKMGANKTLQAHSDWVKDVKFSPNGQLLASASCKVVKLWNPETGALCGTFEGHTDWVRAINFSPDSQFLASASCDKTVKIWNLKTGRFNTLEGHSDWVRTVAFSSDGKLLATGSTDKTVILWDLQTGKIYGVLEGHTGWVRGVAFSPDGQYLASASSDHTVKLWDPKINAAANTTNAHSDSVWMISLSADGQFLASASYDHTVILWDPKTGMPRSTLESHTDAVWAVAFSPDSQCLASASSDKTIKLWDSATGTLRGTLEGHQGVVFAIAFSLDGQLLASASSDKTVKLWDPNTVEALQVLWLPTDQQPRCLSILNNMLVIGYTSGRLTFIEFDLAAVANGDPTEGTGGLLGEFQSETTHARSLKRKHSSD